MTSVQAAGAGVTVHTVTGNIPVSQLGPTLTHEHLWCDVRNYLWQPPEDWKRHLVDQPVSASIAWALREDPFFHPDNCRLDSVPHAVAELRHFQEAGGTTVIDVSTPGMGRDPRRLREIAEDAGIQVVMGAGWYIDPTHPESVRSADVDELAGQLIAEVEHGAEGTPIRPGVLGEIGVSTEPTASEITCLRAAARAQTATGLPLFIHLDGWARTGHDVLDILENEGARPDSVVLGHMNPSGEDFEYQASLAQRGAWLGFDMTGMGFYYADHGGQSPAPDDDARHIARLLDAGLGGRVLVSHDVFVKAMWTIHGGNGYGYIPRLFLPRLRRRFGIDGEQADALLTSNVRDLFVSAAQRGEDA